MGRYLVLFFLFVALWSTALAQEYGLEIVRVEPLGGSPWLVPGVPKVVMRIYVEDNDPTSSGVTINAIRVGQDPGMSVPTTRIAAIRFYDVTTGTRTKIAEATSPTLPSYDPTVITSGLALPWVITPAAFFIPDDSSATFELELEIDPTSFTEGESFRLVVELDQTEGPTSNIVKCVVDDQEDIVSTDTADKGLETVSDERIGAGALTPGATHVLVQEILLGDRDDDGHNCVISQIEVDNPSPATGTAADIDYITFELSGYSPVKVGVSSFPVVFTPPTTWMVSDDATARLKIYVDVSPFATNTHTFKFKTIIRHTENLVSYEKWVWDEEEEYINVPPAPGGLEVIEDKNVGAGLLSPGGDYNTVMEIHLEDHDPAVYTSDVTVYGVYVDNQGTLSIGDVDEIEVRHGNQLLGKVTSPSTVWGGHWGGYISFSTPQVIPDEGSLDIQIKIKLTSGATDGATIRLEVGIEHEETLVIFVKWVSDGTEEVVSSDRIDKGLEVLYVVPESSFGTITPGTTQTVLRMHLEDKDGDADEDDVYITQIRFWNDIRHWGAGTLPLGDREDLFEVIVEGAGAPMKISVTVPPGATKELSPPKGATVQPIVLDFAALTGGTGLKIPDDGSLDLVVKVTANTVVTNGAALRFYMEVDHDEGGTSFTKTDPDGAEEWFRTTGGGGGGGGTAGGTITIGNATLDSTNNWTDWVTISVSNMSLNGMAVFFPGITFDPTKVSAVEVAEITGRTTILSSNISGGHVTFALTNVTGSPITSGPIAKIRFKPVSPVSSQQQVSVCLNPSDVKINGNPFTGNVNCGQITIKPGGVSGVYKGDVNRDGKITIADAVLVARYVMGQETLDSDQFQRADVDCNSVVNIMDAYYIVQYVMNGRQFPCTTGPNSLRVKAEGSVSVTLIRADPTGLMLSFAAPGLAVVHGKLALLGDDRGIARITGKEGAKILAFREMESGVVEFVAVFEAGKGSLELEFANGSVTAASLIQLTAFDKEGNPLTPEVEFEGIEPLEAVIISVKNEPNPVRDVHTTYFRVQATLPVEEIRILIYDLSGRLVYDSGWVENGYGWHLEDLAGQVVANGVYLYTVQVKINGTILQSGFQKLAVLR